MSTTTCTTCPRPLDKAATLNGLTTCTDCHMAEIKASRRGLRSVVVAGDEWSIFTDALRHAAAVSADGRVHQRDVRPRVRGRVQPKHIGQFYRRAKDEQLLVDTGEREPSNDTAGRNTDKLDRIYLLRGAA